MQANTARRESKATRIVTTGTVCSAALTCAVAYAVVVATGSPRVEDDASVADHHRARADCLWRSARDHGFYGVQSRAIGAAVDAAARELWVGFATTAGARECGHPDDDLEPLARALADTRDDADRHFLAGSRVCYASAGEGRIARRPAPPRRRRRRPMVRWPPRSRDTCFSP